MWIMGKCINSLLYIIFISFVLACYPAFSQRKPIALNADNPHYFTYHHRPTLLITSGEHYGAVLNTDFNYTDYLDELQSHGLNLTRTFSGEYVESPTSFNIRHNTLAPVPAHFICPWQRVSDTGEYKFDLSKWNPAYFKRLKDFVKKAAQRGVVVEFTLFCPFYGDEQWNISPLNSRNNVNGVGNIARTNVYTLDKSGKTLAVQEAMVRKIVTELKGFDNVMYEICNEPYFGGVTLDWERHIATIIQDAEQKGHQHLITQNIANVMKKIEHPFPMVSVFEFHYASPPLAVAQNYHLNKVIGNNETGFKGNEDKTYREIAWHFILAGGGLFNNLDYSFATGHEDGTYQYPPTQPGGGSLALRNQLGILKLFMDQFHFIRMKPDTAFIKNKLTGKAACQVLSEKGKQYAVYMSGSRQDHLQVALPQGHYKMTWIDTKTGKILKKDTISIREDLTHLTVPFYKDDIALSLLKAR